MEPSYLTPMKKNKILLATRKKKIANKIYDGNNIGKAMKANGNAEIIAKGTQLLNTSDALKAKRLERDNLQNQVKRLTGELNKLEGTWNADYKAAAGDRKSVV